MWPATEFLGDYTTGSWTSVVATVTSSLNSIYSTSSLHSETWSSCSSCLTSGSGAGVIINLGLDPPINKPRHVDGLSA